MSDSRRSSVTPLECVLEALGLDAGNNHGKVNPVEIKPMVCDSSLGSFNYTTLMSMVLYLALADYLHHICCGLLCQLHV